MIEFCVSFRVRWVLSYSVLLIICFQLRVWTNVSSFMDLQLKPELESFLAGNGHCVSVIVF